MPLIRIGHISRSASSKAVHIWEFSRCTSIAEVGYQRMKVPAVCNSQQLPESVCQTDREKSSFVGCLLHVSKMSKNEVLRFRRFLFLSALFIAFADFTNNWLCVIIGSCSYFVILLTCVTFFRVESSNFYVLKFIK